MAKKRAPSPRALRDEALKVEIQRVYDENLFVYGADKIWTGTRPRCPVEERIPLGDPSSP
jgi:hypothetical protein